MQLSQAVSDESNTTSSAVKGSQSFSRAAASRCAIKLCDRSINIRI